MPGIHASLQVLHLRPVSRGSHQQALRLALQHAPLATQPRSRLLTCRRILGQGHQLGLQADPGALQLPRLGRRPSNRLAQVRHRRLQRPQVRLRAAGQQRVQALVQLLRLTGGALRGVSAALQPRLGRSHSRNQPRQLLL